MMSKQFVETASVKALLDLLKQGLERNRGVLLQGASGSGKTALVAHAAAALSQRELVRVCLDEAVDSKDLIGRFVASSEPGHFIWAAGPLMRAITEGCWLLIEDIDIATLDLLSALRPLLQSGIHDSEQHRFSVTDTGESVPVHRDFRIIATQQLAVEQSTGKVQQRKVKPISSLELWFVLLIRTPPAAEVVQVLRAMCPALPQEAVQRVVDYSIRDPTRMRAMIQWALRVQSRVAGPMSLDPARPFLTSQQKEAIAMEAIDCFFAWLPVDKISAPETVADIARVLDIPAGVFESLVQNHKPQIGQSQMHFSIGRVAFPFATAVGSNPFATTTANHNNNSGQRGGGGGGIFAETRPAMVLLERIAGAVECNEPVLLTGETGVGKTFMVQHLAACLGKTLVVHNVSRQSDCSDFVGGWKPLDMSTLCKMYHNRFCSLFQASFDISKPANGTFLQKLAGIVLEAKYKSAWKSFSKGCTTAESVMDTLDDATRRDWAAFGSDLERSKKRFFASAEEAAKSFSFEEGTLVKAWSRGHWLLIDEINLAESDVLERIGSIIGDGAASSSSAPSLLVVERGDTVPLPRHPDFRLFANMNPPTDVGKKSLPPSLRSRFTEFYVEDARHPNDVAIVVTAYLSDVVAQPPVPGIVSFFLDCVNNARVRLADAGGGGGGGGSRIPHFSLRTLARALSYTRQATATYGFAIALFDGLTLGFASGIDPRHHTVVHTAMARLVFGGRLPVLKRPAAMPTSGSCTGNFVPFEHLWLPAGPHFVNSDGAHHHHQQLQQQQQGVDQQIMMAMNNTVINNFIVTKSVSSYLLNVSRAVVANRPVLLEGPTSAGKSSMVAYLAALTGHECVRINNHDGTDVQEYFGFFVPDEHGTLRHVDGILVSAVRAGKWVILDELNLAPTEVLEALNRLLDDNAELFVPETQEVIRAHPAFRIFATQNPHGAYGGRKQLSRALRNRFLEVFVDDIPSEELVEILVRRFQLAESFAQRMVEVMDELHRRRQDSHVFAGKRGAFLTPRDLFRWAKRRPDTYERLAEHGLVLLAQRCRHARERKTVQDVLEQVMRVNIKAWEVLSVKRWPFVKQHFDKLTQLVAASTSSSSAAPVARGIVWTEPMLELFTVVGLAIQHQEPVLLVGETGASKTTVCQLWAEALGRRASIVNCHQHLESSDLLGAMRPTSAQNRAALFAWCDGPIVQSLRAGDAFVLDEISLAEDAVLERLNSVLEPERTLTLSEKTGGETITAAAEFRFFATMNPGGDFGKRELSPALRNRFTEIFVTPVTEIADAEQILQRKLISEAQHLAHAMATVLHRAISPASAAAAAAVTASTSAAAALTTTTTKPVLQAAGGASASAARHISIRDIVGWAEFVNATFLRCQHSPTQPEQQHQQQQPERIDFNNKHASYLHGAALVLLDGVSVGGDTSEDAARQLRNRLLHLTCGAVGIAVPDAQRVLDEPFWNICRDVVSPEEAQQRQLEQHMLDQGGEAAASSSCPASRYCFSSEVTVRNSSKLLRALMMPGKAVLLEGAPGVGKTSIVEALAAVFSHPVVRINFSEQTDLGDLLGTYLPAASSSSSNNKKKAPSPTSSSETAAAADADVDATAAGVAVDADEAETTGNGGDGEKRDQTFEWCDGILLQAVKAGKWVILDELNLANQTVLEGLNSLLDHRRTLVVPECDLEVAAHPDLRIFACQNPVAGGGGRKGLPRSFLNRFSRVAIERLGAGDMVWIVQKQFPSISHDICTRIVQFVSHLTDAHTEIGNKNNKNSSSSKAMEQSKSSNSNSKKQTSAKQMKVAVSSSGRFGAAGGPWEFNLRDCLRWAFLMTKFGMQEQPGWFVDDLFTLRFRYGEDRAFVHRAFTDIFGSAIAPLRSYVYHKQQNQLCSGDCVIPPLDEAQQQQQQQNVDEQATQQQTDQQRQQAQLLILPEQRHALAAVLRAVSLKQLVLLVGPAASGKSSVIELAASLLGARVVTFHLTAGCDTSDLLGGFVQSSTGSFVWRDSVLVEAMEKGHCAVLDNANFCSPSVLDRLNSVVEPNGTLVLNEQGLTESGGKLRVVRPHPRFRLFATIDPKHGEPSRAMRNRAVEIFLPGIETTSLSAAVLMAQRISNDNSKASASQQQQQQKAQPDNHGKFRGQLIDCFNSCAAALYGSSASSSPAAGFLTLCRVANMVLSAASSPSSSSAAAVGAPDESEVKKWIRSVMIDHSVAIASKIQQQQSNNNSKNNSNNDRHLLTQIQNDSFLFDYCAPDERFRVYPDRDLMTAFSSGNNNHINCTLALVRPLLLPFQRLQFQQQLQQQQQRQQQPLDDASTRLVTLFVVAASTVLRPALLLDPAVAQWLQSCLRQHPRLLQAVGSTFTAICNGHSASAQQPQLQQRVGTVLLASRLCHQEVTLWAPLAERLQQFHDTGVGYRRELTAALNFCAELISSLREPQGSGGFGVAPLESTTFEFTSSTLVQLCVAALDEGRFSDDGLNRVGALLCLITMATAPAANDNSNTDNNSVVSTRQALESSLAATFNISNLFAPAPDRFVRWSPSLRTARSALDQLWRLRAAFASSRNAKNGLLQAVPGMARFSVQFLVEMLGALLSSSQEQEQKQTAPLFMRKLVAYRDLLAPAASSSSPTTAAVFPSALIQEVLQHVSAPSAATEARSASLVCLVLAAIVDLGVGVSRAALAVGDLGWIHAASNFIARLNRAPLSQFHGSSSSNTRIGSGVLHHTRLFSQLVVLEAVPTKSRAVTAALHSIIASGTENQRPQHLRSRLNSAVCSLVSMHIAQCLPASPIDPLLVRTLAFEAAKQAAAHWQSMLSGGAAEIEDIFNFDASRPLENYFTSTLRTIAQQHERRAAAAQVPSRAEIAMLDGIAVNNDEDDDDAVSSANSGALTYVEVFRELHSVASQLLDPARVTHLFAKTATSGGADRRRDRVGDEIQRSDEQGQDEDEDVDQIREKRAVWCELAQQSISNLLYAKQNHAFGDVIVPFAAHTLFASLAASAADFLAVAAEEDCSSSPSSSSSSAVVALLSNLQLPSPTVPSVLCGEYSPHRYSSKRAYVTALSTSLRRLRQNPRAWGRADVSGIFALYRSIFTMIEEAEQSASAAAAAAAIQYMETTHLVIEDDADVLKARMTQLFPSYIKQFDDVTEAVAASSRERAVTGEQLHAQQMDNGADDEDDLAEEDSAVVSFKALLSEHNAEKLFELMSSHHQVFRALTRDNVATGSSKNSSNKNEGDFSALKSFNEWFDAALALVDENHAATASLPLDDPSSANSKVPRLACAVAHRLGKGSSNDNGSSINCRNSNGNMYTDPFPSEALEALPTLIDFRGTIHGFLQQFPDNVTLLKLQALISRVLSLPPQSTPLMQILTGTELLLKESYEWQRVASREVSIVQHIYAVSKLVLRWRRMELHAWPDAFKLVQREHQAKLFDQWTRLYDIVVAGDCKRDQTVAGGAAATALPVEVVCCRAVNAMMKTATLGQFSTALGFIRTFADHAKWLASTPLPPISQQPQLQRPQEHQQQHLLLLQKQQQFESLGEILDRLHSFYAQFDKTVQRELQLQLEPTTTDLDNFIKIAKWEDSTYHAIRAQAEKSHLHISRLLSQFERTLAQPAHVAIAAADKSQTEKNIAFPLVDAATATSSASTGASAADAMLVVGKRSRRAAIKALHAGEDILSAKKKRSASGDKKSQKEKKKEKEKKRKLRQQQQEKKKKRLAAAAAGGDGALNEDDDDDEDDEEEEEEEEVFPLPFPGDSRLGHLVTFLDSTSIRIVETATELAQKGTFALKSRSLKQLFDLFDNDAPERILSGRQNQVTSPLFSATWHDWLEPLIVHSINHRSNTNIKNSNLRQLPQYVAATSAAASPILSALVSTAAAVVAGPAAGGRRPDQFTAADTEVHFFRAAREVILLREVKDRAHADLSDGQVSRGVALVNSLYHCAATCYASARSWFRCVAALDEVRRRKEQQKQEQQQQQSNNNIVASGIDSSASLLALLGSLETCIRGTVNQIAEIRAIQPNQPQQQQQQITSTSSSSGVQEPPASLSTLEASLQSALARTLECRSRAELGFSLTAVDLRQLVSFIRTSAQSQCRQLAEQQREASSAAAAFAPSVSAAACADALFGAVQEFSSLIAKFEQAASCNSNSGKSSSASKSAIKNMSVFLRKNVMSAQLSAAAAAAAASQSTSTLAAQAKELAGDAFWTELQQQLSQLEPALFAMLASSAPSADQQQQQQTDVTACLDTMRLCSGGVWRLFAASTDLAFVVCRIFVNLAQFGFCKSEDEEDGDGNGDGGEGGGDQNKEGTGMDDGKGEKDVTNELQNEDQLMNEKDMKEQEQQQQEEDSDKEDNAADVETDFQAAKENQSGDDDDDEDEESDVDSENDEMGDVDDDFVRDRKRKRTESDDSDLASEDDNKSGDNDNMEEVPPDGSDEDDEDGSGGDEEDGDAAKREEQINRKKDKDKDIKDLELTADGGKLDDVDEEQQDEAEVYDNQQQPTDDEQKEQDDQLPADEDAVENKKDENADAEGDDDDDDDDKSKKQHGPDELPPDDDDQDGDDDNVEKFAEADDDTEHQGDQQNDDNTGDEQKQEQDKRDEKNQQQQQKNAQQQSDPSGIEQQQPQQQQTNDAAGRSWQRKMKQEKQQQSKRKEQKDSGRSTENDKAPNTKKDDDPKGAKKAKRDKVVNDDDEAGVENDEDDTKKNNEDNNIEEEDDLHIDDDAEGLVKLPAAVLPQPDSAEQKQEDEQDEEDDEEGENDDDDKAKDSRRKHKQRDGADELDDDDDDADKKKNNNNKRRNKKKNTASRKKRDDEEDEDGNLPDEEEAPLDQEDLDALGELALSDWRRSEQAVEGLAQQLCEQLRLILTPTVADKLEGDFKSGKRLNMKKVVQYIASNYRKDRIWMRRSKPNKRSYQIMIAVDDSQSMRLNRADEASRNAVALLLKSMAQLEVGEVSVVSFGAEPQLVHDFQDPIDERAGPNIFRNIRFDQNNTSAKRLLTQSLDWLDDARARASASTRATRHDHLQALFILSDGHLTENREEVRRLVARAEANNQMIVFIILDVNNNNNNNDNNKNNNSDSRAQEDDDNQQLVAASAAAAGANRARQEELDAMSNAKRMRTLRDERDARLKLGAASSKSIFEMQVVEFQGQKVVKKPYLELFPFPYYLVVEDIVRLPDILADALRQWFELFAERSGE